VNGENFPRALKRRWPRIPKEKMPDSTRSQKNFWNLLFHPGPWAVKNGLAAILLVLMVVLMSGLTSAYIQVTTTTRVIAPELLGDKSFLLLFSLDLLLPLTVALLSKRAFMAYLIIQCFLSSILLHYNIFFYNTLTLSTIYHSLQGAASLGIDIFGFARWEIILALGLLLAVELFLAQIAMFPRPNMPSFFKWRGISAVICMAVICWLALHIYGRTGLSIIWVEPRGHRPAAERRLEEGARESVRNIGYVGTWLGEFFSGTYRDTTLIYAEARCSSPDGGVCLAAAEAGEPRLWRGLPLPPLSRTLIMIQAESLDFAALDMRVNGQAVTPFLNQLARHSLTLKVFAPHKVGSCNSDYELLNGRIAEQNVVYYTYIKDYPDSVIHLLERKGYAPAFFHGLGGSLFNLREAYSAQGFQEFHFKEELLTEGYKSTRLIMEHIRDEDVLDSAARHLRPEDLSARFIVTMSSHVPFLPAAPEFKSAGGSFARYVTSLNYLDRSLADFYERLPEGTLLIIWGDHGSDVDYPRGFAPGDRHVPFLVHVKGDEVWLEEGRTNRPRGGRNPSEGLEEAGLNRDGRVHSLCELSHYLRCLFQ